MRLPPLDVIETRGLIHHARGDIEVDFIVYVNDEPRGRTSSLHRARDIAREFRASDRWRPTVVRPLFYDPETGDELDAVEGCRRLGLDAWKAGADART